MADVYKELFSQSNVPQLLLNEQGMISSWNDAFSFLLLELSGQKPEEISVPFFEWLQTHDPYQYTYYFAELMAGKISSTTIEAKLPACSGDKKWLRIAMHLVRCTSDTAGSGFQKVILCSFTDVTDQKIHERTLLAAKEEAEKATLTKSQFLANMSHEIRTPIQTILGMTELLKDTRLDKEQIEYIHTVRFSADVLLGLVNDVLDFSKIEAGKLQLEYIDFDIRSIVSQSISLIVMDAHKKALEVIINIDASVPGIIHADPGRIRQIIVNLFKNAVKFTHQGEIIISVNSANGFLTCTVSDTGTGVPQDIRTKLFSPFIQANAGAITHGGTGLGLAISKHLVEAMKGTIFFEPNKPHGSIFGFSIPVEPVPYAGETPQLRFSSDHAVLVVDDNDSARTWFHNTLTGMGARVTLAASGAEALSLVRSKDQPKAAIYDVCLIDQNMPEMDGWRLAAEIHSEKATSTIPLILLIPEGEGAQESKMRLLTWFNGYVSKPVNIRDLHTAVEQATTEIAELESPEERDIEIALDQIESSELPLQVLLVEDHTINQELYTILLEKFGCIVDLANNGAEAVERSACKAYDIVLMDIFMPVMDGYEATQHIREQGFEKPIIAITASAITGEHDKCIRAGMNDVLAKPFKRKDLETMLRFWSNKSSSSARSPELQDSESQQAAQENTTAFIDIFDYHDLLNTFLNNEDTVKNLITRFIQKAEDQKVQLLKAFQNGNTAEVREIAHSIKGASWNMTAKKLGNIARDIEYAARDNDTDGIRSIMPLFESALQEFAKTARPFAH